MTENKRNFDQAADSWDENPMRVKMAADVAHAISTQIPLTSDMEALDFGCGTGLLTLHLQPKVKSITGADSSKGMLDVLNRKISSYHLTHVKTRHLDLDKGDTLTGSYHLITCNMTLHHIPEINHLLGQFYKITAPGGYLCISDLDSEHGLFHGDNTGVFHFGFDRKILRNAFSDAGFTNIRDVTATEIKRPGSDGIIRHFTIFLMTGCGKTG